jgi:hypothetical protein
MTTTDDLRTLDSHELRSPVEQANPPISDPHHPTGAIDVAPARFRRIGI